MSNVNLYLPESVEMMPSKKAYLFRAGFKDSTAVLDDGMRNIVNSIYAIGLELSDAKLYHMTMQIEDVPNEIIPECFKDSEIISIFVSTIGEKIDKAIQDYLAEDKVLHATLLDAWGSESLEALNKSFDARLRLEYGKGTRRFSPGYEDLDIRVNSLIIDLLQVDCVVANSKTGILLPRKSTVCMIGF